MGRDPVVLCFRCGAVLGGQPGYLIELRREGEEFRRAWVCRECQWHLIASGRGRVVVDGREYEYRLV